MESAIAFGQLLKARRNALGMSQEAFADSIRYHRTEISILERGLRDPRLETICCIARGLGITPSELLDGLDLDAFGAARSTDESAPSRAQQIASRCVPRDYSDEDRALGEALRQLRETAGMTQDEAGETVGVRGRHVSEVERAQRGLRWDTLRALLRAYGATLADLGKILD